MKHTKIILGIVVIALILLIGFNQMQDRDDSSKIKIGILTMQTGNLAFLGENIVNSANLAAQQLGRTGDIEFIIEDVGDLESQGKSAAIAAQKLIEIDKVDFIIGGMTSNGTLASAPVINNNKVVMITPLTGGQNIDESGEYIFRNGPSDILGGVIPANDIYNKFGFEKVALMTDNAEYTLDIVKHFKSAFSGEIVSDNIITPDSTDYRTDLAKIKVANPDAIFLSTATGVSARYVIKQARELGITAPIFTNFLAYGPDLISVAGQSADGVYVYDPEFNQTSTEVSYFLERYEEEFGFKAPIPFHSTGTYDVIRMGLEATDSGEDVHDYLLENIQNWVGFNGVVSFDEEGNSGTGFILKQIQNGELVLVE